MKRKAVEIILAIYESPETKKRGFNQLKYNRIQEKIPLRMKFQSISGVLKFDT